MGLFRGIVALALSLVAAPAMAANIIVTYTGTVLRGTDTTGVFGSAGASLAGSSYTAVYEVDTERGVRNTSPSRLDSMIGGEFQGNVSPVLGATLTINGLSFNFNGQNLGVHSTFPLGNEFRSYASDRVTTNPYNASFMGNLIRSAGLPSSMETEFNLTAPVTFDGNGNSFQIAYGPGSFPVVRADGLLGPSGVTVAVAGVPEPATWAMMTFGFGAVGGFMRRRIAPAQAAFA